MASSDYKHFAFLLFCCIHEKASPFPHEKRTCMIGSAAFVAPVPKEYSHYCRPCNSPPFACLLFFTYLVYALPKSTSTQNSCFPKFFLTFHLFLEKSIKIFYILRNCCPIFHDCRFHGIQIKKIIQPPLLLEWDLNDFFTCG